MINSFSILVDSVDKYDACVCGEKRGQISI